MIKDEEKRVLNKIEELIKSTGQDSYISHTFEGCVDLARDNIENDTIFSYKMICFTAEEDNKFVNDEYDKLRAEYENLIGEIRAYEKQLKEKEQTIIGLKAKLYDFVSNECFKERA